MEACNDLVFTKRNFTRESLFSGKSFMEITQQ